MTVECKFPKCGREVQSRGYCHTHCEQIRAGEPLRPIGVGAEVHAARSRRAAERRNRIYAEIERMEKAGMNPSAQAAFLNLTRDKLLTYRAAARRAGYAIPLTLEQCGESSKWAELEERMRHQCPRCFLRGPAPGFLHICIGGVMDFIRSGRPAGGEHRDAEGA